MNKKLIIIPFLILVVLSILLTLRFHKTYSVLGNKGYSEYSRKMIDDNTIEIHVVGDAYRIAKNSEWYVLHNETLEAQIAEPHYLYYAKYPNEAFFTGDEEKAKELCDIWQGNWHDIGGMPACTLDLKTLAENSETVVTFSPPVKTFDKGYVSQINGYFTGTYVGFYVADIGDMDINDRTWYTPTFDITIHSPTTTTTTTTIPETTTTMKQPTPPEPPEPLKILIEAFAKFLNALKGIFGFSIFSSSEIGQAGDTYQETFTLTNTLDYDIPDEYYLDGTRSWSYICHKIYDSNENVIQEECKEVSLLKGESYDYTVTWNIPDDAYSGKYYVVIILTEIQKKWDGSQWYEEEPIIIDKESAELEVSGIPEPPPPSIWQSIKSIFLSFINKLIFWK